MVKTRPRRSGTRTWCGTEAGKPDLLYIDLHLVHEVTSPQAFEGLRLAGRKVRRPDLTLATVDHNVPTTRPRQAVAGPALVAAGRTSLRKNCEEFGVPMFGVSDLRQGIVHVIGPEQGLTQPGMTIVCGDSHTSTHGAFGALAFGIGTSEVEHVLATQTLPQATAEDDVRRGQRRAARRRHGEGRDPRDHPARSASSAASATSSSTAATSSATLSMEGRMTVCNMSIEGGARAGLVAPDETTFAYVEGRNFAPEGRRVGAGARVLALAADRRRRRRSTAASSCAARRSSRT